MLLELNYDPVIILLVFELNLYSIVLVLAYIYTFYSLFFFSFCPNCDTIQTVPNHLELKLIFDISLTKVISDFSIIKLWSLWNDA